VFREIALEELQRHKERLVLQSDANRRRLIADWQRVQSPECWRLEVLELVRRHPMWLAALAGAAGTLTFKAFRRPRTAMSRLGRLTKLASVGFSVWRLLRGKKSKP
jgi:hypothetical protein